MANSDYRESPDGRYVLLPNGSALPVEPILLLLELQSRGFALSHEGDDTLSVQPYQKLTREDCNHLRRWKWHIIALLAQPEMVQ